QPKDQQSQDRAARPDMPVGVVVVDRPPAEGDQPGEQPVDQADREVPDALAQCCSSARYLSWQALQVPPRSPNRAFMVETSLPRAAALNAAAAAWKLRSLPAKSSGDCQMSGFARVLATSGPV